MRNSPENNILPLYHRTLGESFDNLPPALKRFHEQAPEAVAQGSFHITRGQGWLRQLLATVMRLPSPGENVPVTLQVRTVGESEYWTRDFAGLRLATRQWLQDGILMETAGPIRFGMRLAADSTAMRFVLVRCWFMGIPLPVALSPRMNATASACDEGWWLQVRIDVPLLGMLSRYEGKVTLSSQS